MSTVDCIFILMLVGFFGMIAMLCIIQNILSEILGAIRQYGEPR